MELLLYFKCSGGCFYKMWTDPFVLHCETSHAAIFGCIEDSAILKYFFIFTNHSPEKRHQIFLVYFCKQILLFPYLIHTSILVPMQFVTTTNAICHYCSITVTDVTDKKIMEIKINQPTL